MRAETAAWLAYVRAEAAVPGAIYVAICSRNRTVAIFPEDIVGKSDEELLAFIAARLVEH